MDNLETTMNLKTLVDALPGGVGVCHVDGNGGIELVYLNDEYYAWLGLGRERRRQYMGGAALQAIHAEDRVAVRAAALSAVQRGGVEAVTCRLLLSDERYRWVNIRMKAVEKKGSLWTVYAFCSDVDELVRARQQLDEAYHQLQNSETSLHTILEHIPGAMVVFEVRDRLLRLRYISEGCEKVSGFTAEETYRKHSLNPLADAHPDSRAFFLEHEWKDIRSGKAISYKYRILCKSGGYKWVHLSLSPVEINGEVLYYGVFRDLDMDELEAVEEQNHFEQMIASMDSAESDDLVARGRLDLNANKVLYYMHCGFGGPAAQEQRSVDEMMSTMLQSVVSADQRRKLSEVIDRRQMLLQFSAGRTSGSAEYQRVNAKSDTLWYSIKYNLALSPSDSHVIAFVYIYDVSERVLENRMMARLGEEEYDVLGLIDVQTQIFESKSVKGVRSLAAAQKVYLKGKFEDIIQNQVRATVLSTEQAELESQLRLEVVLAHLERERSYHVAFSAYRKDGAYRRKRMKFCYLDDTKTFVLYYCTDITELYNREQEQLKATEEALEQARRANASKTDFLSRMSHDMRTPMNAILGLASLLRDRTDPVEIRQDVEQIEQSGKYLLSLINDTLDMNKIEAGKMELRPVPINSEDLFGNVLATAQILTSQKGVRLELRLPPIQHGQWITVVADLARVEQVFMNLISNAVKFTPRGGSVTLRMETVEIGEKVVRDRYVISDTGIGMSEEFQRHLFEPFSQEGRAGSDPESGTGLGLAIVKRIIDLMGGSIRVESTLNVGTTVTLDVAYPRYQGALSAAPRQSADLSVLTGKRVLLCEDHPINAQIAIRLLEKQGVATERAENGRIGVEMFERSPEGYYDAILMDIRMPVMNGIEAARAIRALPDREDARRVPVIAMTANAYDDDVRLCLEAGMNAHLAKPVDPAALYAALAKEMAGKA
ncbi:MAG: ATP-binding protein [Eubacteriales bacterium]|nr:ATP-binding protein [Eubacteriales bacterium]